MQPFRFDSRAAVEVILYLASLSHSPTSHRISKLLYFADRKHLERYGRLICGDTYIAMKHGPVPSGVYDMIKATRDGYIFVFPEAEGAFQVENNHHIVPLRPPDLDWLSDSDIECLKEAVEEFDEQSFGSLTSLSHDSAWDAANENDQIPLEAIVSSLDDSVELLEYIKNPHP